VRPGGGRVGQDPPPIEILTGFESTYQPGHDRDVVETTAHDRRWREDLDLVHRAGLRRIRYPLRWHRIEPEQGRFDWTATDAALDRLRDLGIEPIVDLLHHTSYPRWVGHLGDPRFGPAFVRFVAAVAERYPWLPAYTVCNEPLTTFLMCGDLGMWPPHGRGLQGLIDVAGNAFPAVTEASRLLADALPGALHVHVEVCERHSADDAGARTAELANDRRFMFTDLLLGHPISPERPWVAELVRGGGSALLEIEPGHIDVLGLDYYAHNQWHWTGAWLGTNRAPAPPPLADLMAEYEARYRLPVLIGETNLCGFASDRVSWFKYVLEQCELARDRGVDVRGLCWYPFVDSADWASQLVEQVGSVDPVGVYWLDAGWERRPSSMSRSFAVAAAGAPSSALPAYRFRSPASEWLAGWMPHVSHWDWVDPPEGEPCSNRLIAGHAVGLAFD
jgi:beta-glucosidase/6-phospho-beta-glucosidase/beta-galactosidase